MHSHTNRLPLIAVRENFSHMDATGAVVCKWARHKHSLAPNSAMIMLRSSRDKPRRLGRIHNLFVITFCVEKTKSRGQRFCHSPLPPSKTKMLPLLAPAPCARPNPLSAMRCDQKCRQEVKGCFRADCSMFTDPGFTAPNE